MVTTTVITTMEVMTAIPLEKPLFSSHMHIGVNATLKKTDQAIGINIKAADLSEKIIRIRQISP